MIKNNKYNLGFAHGWKTERLPNLEYDWLIVNFKEDKKEEK